MLRHADGPRTAARCVALGLFMMCFAMSAGCGKIVRRLARKLSNDDSILPTLTTGTPGATPKGPPPKTPANLSLSWTKNDFTIPEMSIKGSAHPSNLGYYVHLDKLPAGTKISLGETDSTAPDYGDFTGTYDFAARYGELAPKDALSYEYKFDPKAKVHLTFPDGATFDIPLPADSVGYGIKEELKKVRDGHGVLFGKESDASPKEHTILPVESIGDDVFGPATKLSDVDWIGLEEKHPGRDAGRTCSGYTTTNDPTERTHPLVFVDSTATIYERKTGKIVDKKDFTASTECPTFAMGDKAEAWADSEAIKAWYRQRRLQK